MQVNPLLRSLAWLLALVLVALPVVAVVEGWMGAEHWPLRTLRVQGAAASGSIARSCRRRCCRTRGAASSRCDLDAMRRPPSTRLPWVERAEVRKRWPDVLEVRIVEHRPFARWGEQQLLSEHGRLFPVGRLQRAAGPAAAGWAGSAGCAEVVALYNQARELLANAGGVRAAWRWTAAAAGRQPGATAPAWWSAAASPARGWRGSRAMLPQLAAQNPHRRLVARRPSLHQWLRPDLGEGRTDPHEPRQQHMNRKGDKSLIVGLDIGTSKVIALVGEYAAGRADRGDRHRLARIARTAPRRGGRHRIHRAVDPARGRGSRADGRLRDPLGVRVDLRQPRAVPQLARASCRSATARSPTATSTACWKPPRRWRSRPTSRSCTRSRANTCWTIRRKASATRSA